MHTEAVVALKLTDWIPDHLEGDMIGADKGALVLAQRHIPMKLAIGDFDSVNEDEFHLIEESAEEVVRLNPIKDDSDSEAAMNLLYQRGYSFITLLDPLGGRADQAYVNLMLAWKHPEKLRLLDKQNEIFALNAGQYTILKENYAYISFFTMEKAVITLEGMKYPLQKREITRNDLYTLSNEIAEDRGTLTIHSGRLIVMQTRDADEAVCS